MTALDLARDIALKLIEKSGVREWDSAEIRASIAAAAVEMATAIYFEEFDPMATQSILIPEMAGTPKQIWFGSASGNSITAANDLRDATSGNRTFAAITLASLANSSSESTGARQSAKVDLGAVRAPVYRVAACFEIAATPTAGNVIEAWWSPSLSATAGNANSGGASGTDAAYTGYSSNISASLKQCQYIGEFVCTAQATSTKQVGRIGIFVPKERYGSLILFNKSGAALHSTDTEIHVVLDPFFPSVQAAA